MITVHRNIGDAMHDTDARGRLHREQRGAARLAQIVVKAAGAVAPPDHLQGRVQIGACQHRPRNDVARDPDHLVPRSDVVDRLHQTRVVERERVPGQQARRAEAREADSMERAHAREEAVAVELGLVVLVVSDDGGLVPARADHDGRATGIFGVTLIAPAGNVATTVPQEDVVEVGAGPVGDTLDLAQVLGKRIARRCCERREPIASRPRALQCPKALEMNHDAVKRVCARFTECAAYLVGIARHFYAVHQTRVTRSRYS